MSPFVELTFEGPLARLTMKRADKLGHAYGLEGTHADWAWWRARFSARPCEPQTKRRRSTRAHREERVVCAWSMRRARPIVPAPLPSAGPAIGRLRRHQRPP